MATFTMQGITVRSASRNDLYSRNLAATWTAADPDHRDTTRPEFWFDHSPMTECYLLEDEHGVILFLRIDTKRDTVTLHVQFPPELTDATEAASQRERTMDCLSRIFTLVEKVLALRGITRVCFTSKRPGLIRYCEKRLGFIRDGDLLVKQIFKE
jgi:hypothetical protein